MFLIYINDIVDDIRSVIKLFADDTSLSYAFEDAIVRADVLDSDLERISVWAKQWKMIFNAEKTDVVNYGKDTALSYQLSFNNTLLTETHSHKHLGLTLQSNGKWDTHIASIARKVNTLISCLKSFKYKLRRKALETMYKSFILPIFDYADIIWDSCTLAQSTLLENLHLEAIRIILGGVRGTSHEKLYKESGFISLKERRLNHKLLAYKKITLGLGPNYLQNLLPPLVSSVNPYHRRRPLDRYEPHSKTETYRKSFFPSTTSAWNTLPIHMQETISLGEFKRELNAAATKVPVYYYFGERAEQIVHCRLRLEMSDLNSDLYNRHLTDNPSCTCRRGIDSAEHYLLLCPIYDTISLTTIDTLPGHFRNVNTLPYGDHRISVEENQEIFSSVHSFIKHSNRFSKKS